MSESQNLTIDRITLNDGTRIDLAPDTILVFVGPNNSGKSQALRDMFGYLHTPKDGIVVKSCSWNPLDFNKTEDMLKKYLRDEYYCGGGFKFHNSVLSVCKVRKDRLNELRNVFVSFMDTKNRLISVEPIDCIDYPKEPITQPMHLVAYNEDHSNLLSSHFKDTFGIGIEPYTGGKSILFSVGNEPDIDETNPKKISIQYSNYLRDLPKLHDQGDGMKSFFSIIVNLMDEIKSIIMIDEPESFLHPPQAKGMGMFLGNNSADKQLFISTHSVDIINGLIDTAYNRLNIIRIVRTSDKNSFSILDNEDIVNLRRNYALAYTNVLDGIFHKKVIICESESDCKFYSWILSTICKEGGEYLDVLFIGAGGISGFKSIFDALKTLNVDVSIIADMDIITTPNEITKLIDSNSEDCEKIKKCCSTLLNHIGNGGTDV